MSCARCGKNSSIAIVSKGVLYCPECHMHQFPFTMELVKTRSHGQLWNRTNAVVENAMTIEQFQKCGWFLRKKIERTGYIEYLLEYHGKVKCARCHGYRWPITMKEFCKAYNICSWKKGSLAAGQSFMKNKENELLT